MCQSFMCLSVHKCYRCCPTYQISFRVVALGTQHKFFDEPIKHVLQLVRLVGSVDDVTVIFGIKLGLSAEFTTKKLGRVYKRKPIF